MILSIINKLANEPSKNKKQEILKSYTNNKLFKRVLYLAYNPHINFWIKSIPHYSEITQSNIPPCDITVALDFLENELYKRKITGNIAKEKLIEKMNMLSVPDMVVVRYIIDKSFHCGISEKSINKAFGEKLIPSIGYMRCSLFDDRIKKEFNFPAYSQIKADGMFVNMVIDSTSVFVSRKGKPYDFFGMFDDTMDKIYKFFDGIPQVIHGEALILREGKILDRKTGNGILQKFGKGTGTLKVADEIVLDIWDIMPLQDFNDGICTTPYNIRFATLQGVILACNDDKIQIIENKVVENFSEAFSHFKDAVGRGLEGTVLKDASNLLWKNHNSRHQVKMKVKFQIELEVTGLNKGTGKNIGTFGSVQCKSSDNLLQCNVSGFTDEKRNEIYKDDDFIGTIITVESSELIKSKKSNVYKLFLPEFQEIRDDKNKADDLETIKKSYESAVEMADKIYS